MFCGSIDSFSVTVYNTDMETEAGELTMDQLAERVGIPVRTVRFYITEGLLPGPSGRGKAAAYGDDHLARLRLIRRLTEQHVPLAEIRARLADLTGNDVRALLAEEERHSEELRVADTRPSPRDYVTALLRRAQAARWTPDGLAPAASAPTSPPEVRVTQRPPKARPAPRQDSGQSWRRWELAPGVELHVEETAEEPYRDLIQRILDLGRGRP